MSTATRRSRLRARIPLQQEWIVAVIHVTALFMTLIDTMIVNVALPTLARELHGRTESIEWVATGYLLSLAVFIPASGWIGDRFGTKRVFLAALALFTAASMLCGAASSLDMLVAFRVLQGIGGGMLTPVGLAMLWRAFPPERRATAARVLVIPTAVGPATGPIIGGFLVDHVSWRWCFYVNVPIGLVVFTLGVMLLEEHREPQRGRFDTAGFILSGASLALILYALGRAPHDGWGSMVVVLTGLVGVTLFGAFVTTELRLEHPMLRLRLLRLRLFRNATLLVSALMASFLGLLFVMPLYLQTVRHASALQSGFATFPEAVGVIVASQIAGRLYSRIGPRRLMTGGLVAIAVGMFVLSRVLELDTSLWTIRAFMFGLGFSLAFCAVPMQAAAFATIPSSETGHASAIFNTVRQASAAFGIAILATVLAALLPDSGVPATSVHAYRVALCVSAGMAVLGVCAASRISDADAAPTMRRRVVTPPS